MHWVPPLLFTGTLMEAIVYNLNGKKKSMPQFIYSHTHSKHMHTYAYTSVYTQSKRVRVDLPTSKTCEAQMRYTQMIFDKYAI